MAKVRYDVTDVEAGGEQPQPGIYKARIVGANRRETDGKNDIEVTAEVIDHKRFGGGRVWAYVHMGEASKWKLREFTDALGLRAKGTLDTDKLVGKELGIVVVGDSWEGAYRARINRFLNLDALDEEELDDEEDEDEDIEDEEDEDEEEEETPKAKAKKGKAISPKAKSKDEDEDEDEEDEDEDEDEDDEDEDDEEEDEDDEAEDYNEWALNELKEELESRGLPTKGSKKLLIKRLEKDDTSAEEPF